MIVSAAAVRDSDGKELGKVYFDITNHQERSERISDLLNSVYVSSKDLLPPTFTIKFDKA